MNAREERGLVIAALCKLNQTADGWLVPSQSGERIYRVNVEKQTCTCPDHTESGFKCKHLYAVEFTIKREVNPDGSVTETKTLTFTEKVTYKQDWPAYNYAQSIEKDRLQELLFDLCRGLEEPVATRAAAASRTPSRIRSSRRCSRSTALFSSRRFSCDLRAAHERGWLSRPIPGLKVPQFFENPACTPILKGLIVLSSLPLRSVETRFAIDSSGFSTNKINRWSTTSTASPAAPVLGQGPVATGVKTNVVTAVRIFDKEPPTPAVRPDLIKDEAPDFEIDEVTADKA